MIQICRLKSITLSERIRQLVPQYDSTLNKCISKCSHPKWAFKTLVQLLCGTSVKLVYKYGLFHRGRNSTLFCCFLIQTHLMMVKKYWPLSIKILIDFSQIFLVVCIQCMIITPLPFLSITNMNSSKKKLLFVMTLD